MLLIRISKSKNAKRKLKPVLIILPLIEVNGRRPRQDIRRTFKVRQALMRISVSIDDDPTRIAQELTGIMDKTDLIREALKALFERESARRLALLRGTMPELKNIPCL
jgi:hypothetical protein